MQLILDMGGGNTCENSCITAEMMIKEVFKADSGKHDIVLKWQLFKDAPPNKPLDRDVFDHAYHFAKNYGYETTASVFDEDSLDFLMGYDIPFVKIACRPELYYLAYESDVPVYISVSDNDIEPACDVKLACVREYPATVEQYANFKSLKYISDHTVGWDLYRKYQPEILEKHFVHFRNLGNPDAGPFAVTGKELLEIMR